MATTNQATTFAEAGVTLHAKLMSALQASAAAGSNNNTSTNSNATSPTNNNSSNNNNTSAASHLAITPTPLLTRVLRRTAADFADVIVDGRCATGSRQVGSAAAIWVHHNTAVRNANANSSAATSPASSAATTAAAGSTTNNNNNNSGTNVNNGSGASSASPAGAAGAATTAAATGATAALNSTGGVTPLYYTEAALNECRHLLALYSFHCLLTASQLYNHSTNNTSQHVHAAVDGRVHQLPANAHQWAPEVSFIIAETEASAEEMLKLCRSLAEACNSDVQVSTAIGSKTPASIIARPPSATGTSNSATTTAAAAAASKGEAESGKKDEKKRSAAELPCAASIIITTTHSFLNWNLTTLLNTGVDVPIIEDGAVGAATNANTAPAPAAAAAVSSDADANKDKEKDGKDTAAAVAAKEVKVKRVFPHIASIVVEEIGRATTASPSAERALQQWRDAHAALTTAMTRQHPRYCGAAHLLPHVLWICRGPLSRLPSSLRQLLSRRSRRYYQLLPSTYIPSVTASLMPQPVEGLSTPAESLGIRLVLSQSTADKDAQLRRIVTDRSGLYHRVLILTHNKEVPQLNTLITGWGVSREYPSNSGNNNNNPATSAAGQVMTDVSPNLVHSTRRMDSMVAQHQCHTSYLNSCEAAERATVNPPAGEEANSKDTNTDAKRTGGATSSGQPGNSPTTSSPVVVTLVAWDAFTALDVMDVDIIVQYYPPQKSLTEQEWAEFIQLLHTTIDGEREIELSLRQNRNNKEDNIRAKLSQLLQATTTGSDGQTSSTNHHSANGGASSSSSALTSHAPSRAAATPHRPLPVLVTLMVAADFTLTAYFLHQYMYSGATGTLLPSATATSLASIAPMPGKPGVQEPLEHPVPVLDISPKHPYFIPLVCGHDGGADWPAGAAGSPPQPRVSAPDTIKSAGNNNSSNNNNATSSGNDAPLLTHLGSGQPVTVRSVLAAKLAKEQSRTDNGGNIGGPVKSPGTVGAAGAASAPSPVMLLAQGNAALNSGSKAGMGDGGNLARLVAKSGMNASSSSSNNPGANALSNGAGHHNNAAAHSSSQQQQQRGKDGAAGSGSGGAANAQKANAGNNNNGASGKGGKAGTNVNVNSSSTTSSNVGAGAASTAAAVGQGEHKSPTPAATSPSSKAGSGGGSKRRQRSGKGNNNNNNSNNNGASNSAGSVANSGNANASNNNSNNSGKKN